MKIGVTIDHVQDSHSGKTPSYAEMRAMAQLADDNKLDSIWVFDHLLFRFEPEVTGAIWEGLTLLTALAEATSHVELGTLVLCNPFRNPALLAKMAHSIDEISGGRLILGIGAGWHKPEFDAFGYPFDYRVSRLEEALQILHPLLNGESVTFNGRFYQVDNCEIVPAGPRNSIPLLMGAFGPRMLGLTARFANQWNTVWHGDPAEIAEPLSRVRAACEAAGRDPATLEITAGTSVALDEFGKTSGLGEKTLSGTAEELAVAFKGFEEAGVSHLIVHVTPGTLPAYERVAEAVTIYKADAA